MKHEKRKKLLLISVGILILLVGIGAICYPMISAYFAEQTKSEVSTEYYKNVKEKDSEELAAIIASAQEYNRRYFLGEIDVYSPEGIQACGYYNELNIMGNGIMGYIDVPTAGINLPIYHGIGSEEMSIGAGHMPQSSLPVGGENTHSVISAHTGQASNPLFTNLPAIKKGDIFFVRILNMTLAYQVDYIDVVKPWETDAVKIESGKDYVTLLTCYPYPALTERLIVRGERVDYIEMEQEAQFGLDQEQREKAQYFYYENWMIGIYIGAAIFAVMLMCFTFAKLIKKLKKGGHNGKEK